MNLVSQQVLDMNVANNHKNGKRQKNREMILLFPHPSFANYTLPISREKGNFVSL